MISFIKKFFKKGHERSQKAKKNIFFSFLLRGMNIGVGLLLVPLILGYIDETRYGIWLTLSSVILWFNFFDVGLGHGLRNKLGEALATGNLELGRRYISTAYAIISVIAGTIFIVGLIIHQFLDWSVLLGAPEMSKVELGNLALIVFIFFVSRLVLNLLVSVLMADQRPAIKDLIEALGKVGTLTVLWVLTRTTEGSLLYVGAVVGSAPVIMMFLFTIGTYLSRYRHLAPRFSSIDRSLFPDLMTIGGRFFVLQLAAVVLYTTDNMIITHLFSPADVTPYQIASKYFSIALIGFSILVSPMWSAATDAYAKNDVEWISNSVAKLVKIWMLSVLGILLMLLVSPWVYEIWLMGKLDIPFKLSMVWAVFIIIQTLNLIFVQVVNGMGKVQLQMIIGISAAVINIPLSIFLARDMELGLPGVIGATLITQIVALFAMSIQYKKIISGNSHGIWEK